MNGKQQNSSSVDGSSATGATEDTTESFGDKETERNQGEIRPTEILSDLDTENFNSEGYNEDLCGIL